MLMLNRIWWCMCAPGACSWHLTLQQASKNPMVFHFSLLDLLGSSSLWHGMIASTDAGLSLLFNYLSLIGPLTFYVIITKLSLTPFRICIICVHSEALGLKSVLLEVGIVYGIHFLTVWRWEADSQVLGKYIFFWELSSRFPNLWIVYWVKP